jgi:hypothetical protein
MAIYLLLFPELFYKMPRREQISPLLGCVSFNPNAEIGPMVAWDYLLQGKAALWQSFPVGE